MSSIFNYRYYIAIIMVEDNQKEAAILKKNQDKDDKSKPEIKKEKSL